MFREFNVKFEDVEIIGGSDNLLEGTEVTKVILRGDSKMSSLDSALKNCSELDTIDGDLDLNGVNDIDNLLEDTPLVKEISVKNVNVEDMSCDNSFTNINTLNIAGDSKKKAIQNLLGNMDWEFDGVNYTGDMVDVVTDKMEVLTDEECNVEVVDALEQKVRSLEIKGQTYKNLIDGKEEKELVDNFITTVVDDNTSFEDTVERDLKIIEIQGNTLQNLIDGEDEVELIDDFRATVSGDNTSFDETYYTREVKISEIQGNTLQNLIEGKEEKRLTGEVKELTINSNDSISTNLEEYEVLEFIGDTWQDTSLVPKEYVHFSNTVLESLSLTEPINFTNGDYIEFSVDLSSYTKTSLMGVFSTALDNPDTWSGKSKYHVYFLPSSQELRLQVVQGGYSTTHSITYNPSIPLVVRIDSNGITYNGVEPSTFIGTSEYNSTITDYNDASQIMIGREGASKFDGIYNYIKIVKQEPNLSNIQSVGDLYTDEEGDPILDEEGNEQYVVKIRVSNSPFGKRGRL